MKRRDIKVLVVCNEKEKSKYEFLSSFGYDVLPIVTDGVAALESVSLNKPEVILSEVFLPQLDFCGILDILNKYRGVLIGVSNCPNDKLAARLMKKGADYFFIQPFQNKYLAKVIDDFVVEKLEKTSFDENVCKNDLLESAVMEMLHNLGMPTNLLGYNYIREAIMMGFADESILKPFTTGLYCGIAQLFKTNPKSVERAMRTAISSAWTRGDLEAQLAVFGYTISSEKGKPTNSEFVTKIVDKLRIKLEN